jgi:membrane-bound lytic murein transglycosylase MltF
MSTHVSLSWIGLLSALFIGCDLPKDPDKTWNEAHEIGLQVGVVVDTPFVMQENGEWRGEEIELIRRFATEHRLKIQFHERSESEVVRQLERSELHVAAGGFHNDTEWKKKVGATRPFPPMDHVFLVAAGENHTLVKLEKWLLGNTE